MPKRRVTGTLPEAFANNLSQLIELETNRNSTKPIYLKVMNPMIDFFGSIWFLIGNLILFAVWICVNTGLLGERLKFDTYPFEFLTLSVSLEAIVLSVVVLIAQNQLQSDSEERAQLDLHINLLAESETTLILKKLERIERQLGIEACDAEQKRVKDLIEDTHPEKLAEFIHDTFNKNRKN